MPLFNLDTALRAQGKALGPHPAFIDPTTPVSTYQVGSGRGDSVISQRSAGRHASAYGGAQAIDWVYDCIGLYADAAGTAAYRLEKSDGTRLVRTKNKGTPPDYEIGPVDFYMLMDKPNPFMLYDELLSLLVIDLMLVGNGYWLKWQNPASGKPLALYRLAPSYVKIVPGPYGAKAYEYQPPGVKDKLLLDPSDVIHFRRPNPHDPYYGMGVIQGAGRAMDLELALTDTITSYYENRAAPSLIVQSERRVPRDVFTKLRAQLRSRVSGSGKSGELLVLEAGLTASSLSTSAADALFKDLATMSRDRIFTKFRASPMLFGLMDQVSASNKVSDVRREFDNATLRPFLSRLSSQVSRDLAEAWDVKYIIDHRSYLPADEAIKVADSLAKAPGAKVRDVRRQYEQFGVDESTGDPEIDNFVLNMPGPEMDANGQIIDPVTGKKVSGQGSADRPIAGEPGRPPLSKNTSGFGVAGVKSVEDRLSVAMSALEAKALNSAGERVTIGNKLPDERRPTDTLSTARAADITGAARIMELGLADAAIRLERALLDQVEGKALKTSDIVSRMRNSAAWKAFRDDTETVIREGVERAAASGALHSGLRPDTELDYAAIADEIVNRDGGLTSIVRTLKGRVAKSIKDSRDTDGERTDYEQAIKKTISGWSTSQAGLIAETEAVHGYNEATLSVAELSGLTHVFVMDGQDDDQPCVDADGSVWEIGHARQNRLEHPRCRRAFLPLTLDAVA